MGEAVHEVRRWHGAACCAPRPRSPSARSCFRSPRAWSARCCPLSAICRRSAATHSALEPWRRLVAYPGFATSLTVTLVVGIAYRGACRDCSRFGFCAWALRASAVARALGAWIAPILATPHSALAIGLAFLIAPSGWIARAISPWLTGWTLPPDVATVGDPRGIALMLGPARQGSALPRADDRRRRCTRCPFAQHMTIARALGYRREAAWIKVILPQVYPQIRLPVFAVLAFSLSVVDVALILGPVQPAAARRARGALVQRRRHLVLFPGRGRGDPASAASSSACIGAVVRRRARRRGSPDGAGSRAASAMASRRRWRGRAAGACAILRRRSRFSRSPAWRCGRSPRNGAFPMRCRRRGRSPTGCGALDEHRRARRGPRSRSARSPRSSRLRSCVACLENEQPCAAGARGAGALWLLYLPLLVPQVAFLFGAQVLLVRLELDGTLAAVVWAHLVFVLPYLFLSLADPWRAFDPRYARSGGEPRRRRRGASFAR